MIARSLVRLIRPSTIAAAVTFALIVVRAVRTVDPYWDTLAYHWGFAARVAGLCDRDCFLFPAIMEARYDGFPLLLHALQGLLWRALGTPGAGDLVNVAAVSALCAYMRWRFSVPLAWCWLALFAIPEVHIELTASLIDLPVNAAVTLGLLVVLRMLVEPEGDHRVDIAIALAALGIAAGSKVLALPAALITWAAIVVLAARSAAPLGYPKRDVALAVLVVAGIVALLPKAASNAYAFGNPFYPVAFDVGSLHFAGPESRHQSNSISSAWTQVSSPVRWLISVAEFDAFRGRPLPWLIGQGDVPQSSPSFRMGGYFVAYVLGALTLVVWSARSAAKGKWAVALVIALSILCMLLPNSHELRYYSFWMMTLVCAVLAGAHSPLLASEDQRYRRRAAHALIAIAAASVVSMTGAAFLQTPDVTLDQLLAQSNATVAQVPDGATLCIRNYDRRAILYAEIFHPGRHYRVRQLQGDEPDASCTLRITISD